MRERSLGLGLVLAAVGAALVLVLRGGGERDAAARAAREPPAPAGERAAAALAAPGEAPADAAAPLAGAPAHATRAVAEVAAPPSAAPEAPPATPGPEETELLVRVLDPAGAPVAGAFALLDAGRSTSLRSTDARGEASFPLPGHVRRDPSATAGVEVVDLAPLEIPLAAALEEGERPLVELRLPPTGAARVRLVDAAGAPLDARFQVELRAVEVGWPDLPGARRGPPVAHEAAEGAVEFDLVALGADLLARPISPFGKPAGAEVRAPGPRAPGERVDLLLVVEAPPVLLGRVVDTDGAPLAGESLVHQLDLLRESGSSSTSGRLVELDADGRFRLATSDVWAPGTRARVKLWRRDDPRLAAEAEVDPLLPGENPLGDLFLRLPPLLAAGVVRGPDGEPVAGARVSARRPSDRWSGLHSLDATSGEAGAFEIRGPIPSDGAGVLVLVAHAGTTTSAAPSEPASVAPGSTGVVLRLRAPSRVAVRTHLADGVRPDEVQLELRSRDASPVSGSGSPSELGPDVGIALGPVPAGRYDLLVSSSRGGALVARVEDIETRSGETTRDPRLDPLDLRDKLRRVRLTVRTSSGARPEELYLRQRPSTAPGLPWSQTLLGDAPLHDVLLVHPPVDLVVGAAGLRAARLERVDSDREVVLEPGLAVRLVLGEHARRLPASARFELRLGEGSGLRRLLHFVPVERGTANELALRLPAPGEWRVHVVDVARVETDVLLRVLDTPREQVLALEIPASAVESVARPASDER